MSCVHHTKINFFFYAPIDVSKCQVSNFDKYLFVFAIIHMQVVFCQLFVSVSFIYLLLLLWLWLLLFYFKDCRESSFHIINIFFSLFFIYHRYNLFYIYLCFQISGIQFQSSNFQVSIFVAWSSRVRKKQGARATQEASSKQGFVCACATHG